MNHVQIITTIILGLIAILFLFPPYCGAAEYFGGINESGVEYKELDFDLAGYPDNQLIGSKCAQNIELNKKCQESVIDTAANARRAELIELIETKRNNMLNDIFPNMNQFVPPEVVNRMN